MEASAEACTVNSAVLAEAQQIQPGAILLDEVKPVDAGSGTGICLACYEKLVREQVDIR